MVMLCALCFSIMEIWFFLPLISIASVIISKSIIVPQGTQNHYLFNNLTRGHQHSLHLSQGFFTNHTYSMPERKKTEKKRYCETNIPVFNLNTVQILKNNKCHGTYLLLLQGKLYRNSVYATNENFKSHMCSFMCCMSEWPAIRNKNAAALVCNVGKHNRRNRIGR